MAGVALAAVVGLTACGADPACAAPLAAGAGLVAAVSGKATFYDSAGMGNCMFEAPADRLFVALGNAAYDDAAACGGYLDVTGPKGKVRVKVTDRCPECQPGHIDLSREAFTRIADPVRGIVPITYRPVVNRPGGRRADLPDQGGRLAVLVRRPGRQPRQPAAVGRGEGAGWDLAADGTAGLQLLARRQRPRPRPVRRADHRRPRSHGDRHRHRHAARRRPADLGPAGWRRRGATRAHPDGGRAHEEADAPPEAVRQPAGIGDRRAGRRRYRGFRGQNGQLRLVSRRHTGR